jgi:fumarate hydratase subunit alpha
MQLKNNIEDVAFKLIKQAVIYLPNDIKTVLNKAYVEETSEIGKSQLKAILDNIELAESHQIPICQDTGTITFYVKAGVHAEGLDQIEEALRDATRRATLEVPLRPNAVDPLTQKNSGDNTGRSVPCVHWEIVQGDCIEFTASVKGGGSENACALGMLNSGEGLKGIKRFAIDAVINAGAKPCPPTFLGIGIGGGADLALLLAKKALVKPLSENPINAQAAALEAEIFEAANMTGIGPMGMGGKTTVLGVRVDYAHRHPASLPIAVAFSCWANRHAHAKIHPDATVEYLSHKTWSKCI